MTTAYGCPWGAAVCSEVVACFDGDADPGSWLHARLRCAVTFLAAWQGEPAQWSSPTGLWLHRPGAIVVAGGSAGWAATSGNHSDLYVHDDRQPEEGGRGWAAMPRVGEARHPGPPIAHEIARRMPLPSASGAVRYPRPGNGSLANAVAPGYDRRDPASEEQFQLVIETVSSTGWSALKRRLQGTTAHAVLAQETWIGQSALAGASDWARRHGWRSLWAPAVTTARGGTSAGVAIFVRECFGLHMPHGRSHVISEARAVMGVMKILGSRPVRLGACYQRHGRWCDGQSELPGSTPAASTPPRESRSW